MFTKKILALANQQRVPIYTINRDNISQTLPLISAPAIVKQNISDSVLNYGWIAVIPQRGLQVNNWFGYGWQVLDPNSGAAGYLLAGYFTSGSAITAGGSGTKPVNDAKVLSIYDKSKLVIGLLAAISGAAVIIGLIAAAILAPSAAGSSLIAAVLSGAITGLFVATMLIAAIFFVWVLVKVIQILLSSLPPNRKKRYAFKAMVALA